MVIPLNARNDFRMILVDKLGNEFKAMLNNSDLVFYNEFYERLRIKEYSYFKRQIFMKKKMVIVSTNLIN
jgi:hypothetical protein